MAKRLYISMALAVLLLSCHKDKPPASASNWGELDLNLQYQNGASPHANIMVQNIPVDVIFDTGSSGLKLLKGLVASTSFVPLKRIHEGYGNGVHNLNITGTVSEANLTIGTLTTQQPVRIMIIDSIQHVDNNVKGTWIYTGDSTAIHGKYFNGFSAILGVGMRMDTSTVGSPVTQLPGSGRYLVEFPVFNQTSGGKVIFNPTATETAQFRQLPKLIAGPIALPNGDTSWLDTNIAGTLTAAGHAYTAGTLLDTGNPAVWAASLSIPTSMTLGPGISVRLQVGQPALADLSFNIQKELSGQDLVELNHTSQPDHNSFGAQFFFSYNVLFDALKGTVSLKHK